MAGKKRKAKNKTGKGSFLSHTWGKIVYLVFFALFVLLIPGANVYTLSGDEDLPNHEKAPLLLPAPAPYPVNRTGIYPGEDISAQGIVILDVGSGVYMYARNEDVVFAPASTTKIMTALVSLDAYELDDVLTAKRIINDGQDMGLVAGERITVENLLFGTLIQSGNDAAYVLADNFPGGVEKFVEEMNKKAREMHLTSSTFTNPMGYDDPGHRMTPKDLATLARVALTNKTIVKMVAIPQITISDVTHTYFHSLSNVNQLLGKVPGVGGIKTGWTEEAGENLVTLVERMGHKVILVVLRSNNRFDDTSKLIDWVFTNYDWKDLRP